MLDLHGPVAVREDDMQYGSLIWAERRQGGPVWEYRWREPGSDGARKHRRIGVGPVSQFEKREDALRAVSALQHDINHAGKRQASAAITIRELFDHYRQRELRADNTSKTASTKHAYEGYITKWICPRWEAFPLARVRAGEVEQWLRSLPLAPGSCAKIRNIMSVLFNHAIRHDLYDRNPIRWVRQSAKRRKAPTVLSSSELQSLLSALDVRERTLMLLDVCTGLRMSELFALKWSDVKFDSGELDVLEPLLFYVLHRASNEITDPGKLATFKVFLMDEAWLFIRNETIRQYIVQAQKTWRKHNAAMVLATQSIKELQESGMLEIVAESCPTKIFLANPDMDRDLYKEAFHLNDTELELIAGLVPPRQMLIRKAQSSKKVHLNVDSVSHWMATNNARDNLKKREYFARFGIADGLRRLAQDYPFQPRTLAATVN
jgi:hypothetical protein